MRVNEVEKSLKDQGECGRCHDALPKGCAYRWIKGRYSARKVRCMKPECRFRQSEMTESKMSGVYAAQENAEEALNAWSNDDGLDALQSLCSDMAESLREVSGEYAEAAEAMGGAGEEMQQKADDLESWADEVESAGDELEAWEAHHEAQIECPECKGGEPGEDSASLTNSETGEYTCTLCNHEFTPEAKDDNGQTLEEWADEARSAVEEAIGNCPL